MSSMHSVARLLPIGLILAVYLTLTAGFHCYECEFEKGDPHDEKHCKEGKLPESFAKDCSYLEDESIDMDDGRLGNVSPKRINRTDLEKRLRQGGTMGCFKWIDKSGKEEYVQKFCAISSATGTGEFCAETKESVECFCLGDRCNGGGSSYGSSISTLAVATCIATVAKGFQLLFFYING